MSSTFPPRVGSVYTERYQLRELLGSGGVGQVFRAWDVQAQRLVAVKAYNPVAVSPTTWAAYIAVVEAARALGHPDLVLPQPQPAALSARPLAVMESLVGEDLATMRARLVRVPWQRAVEIGARCAEILHAVHSGTGVAHRDLKASNVFITEGGVVKLLDYGVAEFDVQAVDRTRVDSALGVVDYKAPEQLESNVADHHADVFSLAVLIFEMIAGDRPFSGASYFVVARKILLEPAPSLSEVAPEAGVPEALDLLLQRALAKRPAERFPDLQAMLRALVEVQRPSPASPVNWRAAALASAARQSPRPATSPGGTLTTEHDVEALRTGRRPVTRSIPQAVVRAVSKPSHGPIIAPDEEATSEGEGAPMTVVMPPRASTTPPRPRAVPEAVHAEPRTLIHHRGSIAPMQPAEQTQILSDSLASASPEATLMLPSDVPAAPAGDFTMILPEEVAPVNSTMQIPEVTLQEMNKSRGLIGDWTMQKMLIVINIFCGVLILLGLLVLVFGDSGMTAER